MVFYFILSTFFCSEIDNPHDLYTKCNFNSLINIFVSGLVTQSCLTLWDPTNCSLSGSSIHGIPQARILEWIAVPFSRGSSWPRDLTQVSCTTSRFFTIWATGKIMKVITIHLKCLGRIYKQKYKIKHFNNLNSHYHPMLFYCVSVNIIS